MSDTPEVGPDEVLVRISGQDSCATVTVNLEEGTSELVEALEGAGGAVVGQRRPPFKPPVEVQIPRSRIQFGTEARGV